MDQLTLLLFSLRSSIPTYTPYTDLHFILSHSSEHKFRAMAFEDWPWERTECLIGEEKVCPFRYPLSAMQNEDK